MKQKFSCYMFHVTCFMNETYLTKAIILNRKPFRECDSMATVYSFDKGKLELAVRGARKISSKLAGHIEPLNLSEIMVVRGRNFDYVGGAVSRNCYANLKSNLEKSLIAGQAVNIFNKLIKKEEQDSKIFILLQDFLNILNENKEFNCELLLNFFILKLLVLLGYKPELYNCAVCGKKITPNGNKFGLSQGGLVCADCQTSPFVPLLSKDGVGGMSLQTSTDCIKVLRLAIKNDFSRLTKLKINDILAKEINNIICSFLKYNNF